jgi:hypothetical protein
MWKEPRLRVFENGVLRRIFGPMKDEVTRDWRRLHKEELHYLVSQNIIRMIRSIRMRLARHVARRGEKRGACRFLVGDLRERDHLEDLGIDGRLIIIKLVFKKRNGRHGLD